jgi:hypothetical protein
MRYIYGVPIFTTVLLVVAGSSVDGFSTSSTAADPKSSRPLLASLSPLATHKTLQRRPSVTQRSKFRLAVSTSQDSRETKQKPSARRYLSRVLLQNLRHLILPRFVHLLCTKLKLSFLLVCTAFLFCFGTLGAGGAQASAPPPASSPIPVSQVSRYLFSAPIDKIVDNYVKNHMFDDDVYDPVESIYREAMDDRIHGTYPKALKMVTSSVLGKDIIKAERSASGTTLGTTLVKMVGFLRQKGLSETQAIALLAGSLVLGTPTIAFVLLMMVGAQNKRSINRLMKKRYGETYTVDATIKVEEDVEAPDDSEDDSEDDEEDEDDEDD